MPVLCGVECCWVIDGIPRFAGCYGRSCLLFFWFASADDVHALRRYGLRRAGDCQPSSQRVRWLVGWRKWQGKGQSGCFKLSLVFSFLPCNLVLLPTYSFRSLQALTIRASCSLLSLLCLVTETSGRTTTSVSHPFCPVSALECSQLQLSQSTRCSPQTVPG